jgi:hypothetical protein
MGCPDDLDRLLELDHQRYGEGPKKGTPRAPGKPPEQAKDAPQSQTSGDPALQPALDVASSAFPMPFSR